MVNDKYGAKSDRPKLRLVGKDGNAFAILGRAHQAARRAGMPEDEWKKIQAEATSGNYDHLLVTMLKYFDCDAEEDEDEPRVPSIEQLEEWMAEGGCEATDGCWVEPDGQCEHGKRSWLLVLGMI
jgi:hypothetical protein